MGYKMMELKLCGLVGIFSNLVEVKVVAFGLDILC